MIKNEQFFQIIMTKEKSFGIIIFAEFSDGIYVIKVHLNNEDLKYKLIKQYKNIDQTKKNKYVRDKQNNPIV